MYQIKLFLCGKEKQFNVSAKINLMPQKKRIKLENYNLIKFNSDSLI